MAAWFVHSFNVVSKLVIKCGEKTQCLRKPDFVRFSEKYKETQTTSKNPDLVEKPISGGPRSVKPMTNRGLQSISQEIIELES